MLKRMAIVTAIYWTALATVCWANKRVDVSNDGLVDSVSSVYGKGAKVDHASNQYSDAEWTAFGITEKAPYIIKDGEVWRDMVQAEKDAVDAVIKQETTVAAEADVDMDALFHAVAESIKNNDKTYEAVKANFKAGVDPKKAKKKEKSK